MNKPEKIKKEQKEISLLGDVIGAICFGIMSVLFIFLLSLSEKIICLNFGYIFLSGMFLIYFGYFFGKRFSSLKHNKEKDK